MMPPVPPVSRPKKRTERTVSFAFTKAMERRHAAIRNTVTYDRSEISDGAEDAEDVKNTNKQMHRKNPLYQTLCIYCNQKFSGSIVQHYVKNHPNDEVPISRLSPRMAERLKKQSEIFRPNGKNKITGLCYFCEEKQSFIKFGWQRHLISHTGEKIYNCTHCNLKTKNQHGKMKCNGKVTKIFESKDDGSLNGFLCIDCNYFQFSRDHLKNQHGFENPTAPHDYMEYVVMRTQN